MYLLFDAGSSVVHLWLYLFNREAVWESGEGIQTMCQPGLRCKQQRVIGHNFI